MEVSGSLPRTPPSTPPRYTLGVDGAWALHARPFLLLATAACGWRIALVLVVWTRHVLLLSTTDAHT